MWDTTATDFSVRIGHYLELRSELEVGLPLLIVTDDPGQTRAAVHALAQRIRKARAGAAGGEIFVPAISARFKRAILHEADACTCTLIMDNNPGRFVIQINGTYPEGKPLASMPVNVLAVLPALPQDLEYRFMGRDLILLDTRANIMLDRILDAIQCADCDRARCHRLTES